MKYRIKTKEEFVNEFGEEDWRRKVDLSFPEQMDPLLGAFITEKFYQMVKKDSSACIHSDHFISYKASFERGKGGCSAYWSVSLEMVKEVSD